MWSKVILTLLVGSVGSWIMLKRKVPAGVLVGAIVGSILLSVSLEMAVMPSAAKVMAQITTGAFLGCGITKEDISHLPQIIRPFLVVLGAFLLLGLALGFLIYLTTPLDLLTSLLCMMPGGVSDTPLIAMDMGADAPKVAVMQFLRMLVGLSTLPGLIIWIDQADARRKGHEPMPAHPVEVVARRMQGQAHAGAAFSLLLTLLAATAGGLFGKLIGIPAGVLTFSMIATLLLKVCYPKAFLPLWLRRLAQLLSGCCIGSTFARSDLLELRFLILPVFLMLAGYLANCILVGKLLHRWFGISLREGMLCASPAGASEMAFISADMGVNSPNLVVMQICRLIVVTALFPQIFLLIVRLIPW